MNHPQVKFRKTFVQATYPDGTSFSVPGNPLLISGMEREMDYEAVPLGYNTIEVFSEVADLEVVHKVMDPVLTDITEKKPQK